MTAGAAATREGDMLLRRLELRHLRYFVAVAEELSFRRAAIRLHISQPPLTTQIQQLESLLETQLFERNKQRVLLTAAGRELLDRARRVLDDVAGLRAVLAGAAGGASGELRVGYTESAVHAGVLLEAVQRVRAQRPGVTLALRPMASAVQLAALEGGELDVGFIWAPEPRTLAAFDCEVVRIEPMAAALPRGHRLARGAGPLSLTALESERFVMIARHNGTAMFRTVLRMCRQAGFAPQIAIEAPDLTSAIGLVSGGAGVTVVPGVMTKINASGVVYREIADEVCRINLYWVSRRGDASPLVAALRQMLLPQPDVPQSVSALPTAPHAGRAIRSGSVDSPSRGSRSRPGGQLPRA